MMDLLVRNQSTMRHLSAKDMILKRPWPIMSLILMSLEMGTRMNLRAISEAEVALLVGEEAIELATYIGVLAHTSIPILYNDWRRVPDFLKTITLVLLLLEKSEKSHILRMKLEGSELHFGTLSTV
ncbi:hypothetical protein WN944_023917 [Citrus x changshan-huyou]|uniref:Uncharacterized protein n=1 Tax=Citrus x changshan-huyou TaxID=2935761 RepID=A0AAP0LMI7_9ROSI